MLKEENIWDLIYLGTSKLVVNHLVFADYLIGIAHILKETNIKVQLLKKCASKTVLQVSFDTTRICL